ncbi:DUF192 domain-containing protein [Sphingobium sp. AN641]|uniref:DUF192 domain-containing protein n=1 Tax=Sphingobium sp. AN641 TaxID=3133443 RepID=UPI0030BCA152
MSRTLVFSALLLLVACKSGADQPDNSASAAAPAQVSLLPLAIRTATADHRFAVEVASTPQEQARGLMFRKQIGPDSGMLFPMTPPRTASFWMKDTLIPLDILFIRTDGTIALIGANRQPYALEPVSAGVPVAAVLELAGGRAAALGIGEGDKVRWGRCADPAGRPAALEFCPTP